MFFYPAVISWFGWLGDTHIPSILSNRAAPISPMSIPMDQCFFSHDSPSMVTFCWIYHGKITIHFWIWLTNDQFPWSIKGKYHMKYPCSGGINRLVFPKLNTVSRWGQADSDGDHRGGRRLASSLAEDHVGAVAERWPRGAQDEDRATRTHLGLDLCQEVRRCFFLLMIRDVYMHGSYCFVISWYLYWYVYI